MNRAPQTMRANVVDLCWFFFVLTRYVHHIRAMCNGKESAKKPTKLYSTHRCYAHHVRSAEEIWNLNRKQVQNTWLCQRESKYYKRNIAGLSIWDLFQVETDWEQARKRSTKARLSVRWSEMMRKGDIERTNQRKSKKQEEASRKKRTWWIKMR